ncbi:MAG: oxidative damage protection protein [Gammaproteobacteria bacterium]|nr:MAG: oxidative damage protection protein [Gammaproteobacteria bacterium]
MVYCVKLQKEAEGLERPPLPGEVGQRVLENISKEAWQQWLGQQTILINEYRLNPMDAQARSFLEEQMLAFLFTDKMEQP